MGGILLKGVHKSGPKIPFFRISLSNSKNIVYYVVKNIVYYAVKKICVKGIKILVNLRLAHWSQT